MALEIPLVLQIPSHAELRNPRSGKVREVYDIDEDKLLFVATDRISAYDVIMKNGVPNKGALLNNLAHYWFTYLQKRIPGLQTHFVSLELPQKLQNDLPPSILAQLQYRSMQVRRLKIFPIEAIVRGYITGSAWKEYSDKGTVHGIKVSGPNGAKLRESEQFESPIYTPSTKAPLGEKDENIHPDQAAEIVSVDYAKRIEELSLKIYTEARDYAITRGIIIADTKFEFGLDEKTDEVVLVDEVLTPDSSRFWPAASYKIGQSQQSFDKQYMRDWLTENGLKGKEGVEMSAEVVANTQSKYVEAFQTIVGTSNWKDYLISTVN